MLMGRREEKKLRKVGNGSLFVGAIVLSGSAGFATASGKVELGEKDVVK